MPAFKYPRLQTVTWAPWDRHSMEQGINVLIGPADGLVSQAQAAIAEETRPADRAMVGGPSAFE